MMKSHVPLFKKTRMQKGAITERGKTAFCYSPFIDYKNTRLQFEDFKYRNYELIYRIVRQLLSTERIDVVFQPQQFFFLLKERTAIPSTISSLTKLDC